MDEWISLEVVKSRGPAVKPAWCFESKDMRYVYEAHFSFLLLLSGKVAKNRAVNLFQAHRRHARKNPDSILRCASDLRQADFYSPLGLVGTPEKPSRRILFADAKMI